MFAPHDQDHGRAGARGLTRNHHGAVARRLRRTAIGAVCAAAVALPLAGAATAQAATSAPHTFTSSWTSLALKNGWADYGFGSAAPAVTNINGIVHLRGNIRTNGTNDEPFILPAGLRPTHLVYVPVGLCGANNGRLKILSDGEVFVEAEGGTLSNAECMTSLDGAEFAKSASLYTPLTLQNGWASYGEGTTSPAARKISGIVHLEGAMSNSTTPFDPAAFTLPAGFRPTHSVDVSVDTSDANRGHIEISPNGQVVVFAEGDVWSNAAFFTSLDGASFAP